MEVLKKGRDQKGWTAKRTCTGKGNGGGGCKAKLLVSASDLYKTYQHSYDGSTELYITFTCPICGVETDIGYVPDSVYDGLCSKKDYLKKKERKTNSDIYESN